MFKRNVIETSKVLDEQEKKVAMINLDDLPEGIREDIEEYMEENNIPRIDNYMKLRSAIDYYLMWQGIVGFTSSIYDIMEKSFYAKIEVNTLNQD